MGWGNNHNIRHFNVVRMEQIMLVAAAGMPVE